MQGKGRGSIFPRSSGCAPYLRGLPEPWVGPPEPLTSPQGCHPELDPVPQPPCSLPDLPSEGSGSCKADGKMLKCEAVCKFKGFIPDFLRTGLLTSPPTLSTPVTTTTPPPPRVTTPGRLCTPGQVGRAQSGSPITSGGTASPFLGVLVCPRVKPGMTAPAPSG